MAEADKLQGLTQYLRSRAQFVAEEELSVRMNRWADAVEALAASPHQVFWLYELERGQGIYQGCTGPKAESIVRQTREGFDEAGEPFAVYASPQPAQGADTTEAKLPELPEARMKFERDTTCVVLGEHPTQYRYAKDAALYTIDQMREYALAAIALNAATEEDRAAILEATQAIRDHGRDLIENEWSSTGESLMAKARKIERIVLKGTHEPQ
jgi:hypothetical protein